MIRKRYKVYSTVVKVYEVIAESEEDVVTKLMEDDIECEYIKDEQWDLQNIQVIKVLEDEEED
jgi:hypothetical protein